MSYVLMLCMFVDAGLFYLFLYVLNKPAMALIMVLSGLCCGLGMFLIDDNKKSKN